MAIAIWQVERFPLITRSSISVLVLHPAVINAYGLSNGVHVEDRAVKRHTKAISQASRVPLFSLLVTADPKPVTTVSAVVLSQIRVYEITRPLKLLSFNEIRKYAGPTVEIGGGS